MALLRDIEGALPFTEPWPVLPGVIRSLAPTVNPGDDDEDDEDDAGDGNKGGNIDPDDDEGYGDDDEDDDDEEPLRVTPPQDARPRLLRRSKPSFHSVGAARLPQRNLRLLRIPSRRRHTARSQSSAPHRVACLHASVSRHR